MTKGFRIDPVDFEIALMNAVTHVDLANQGQLDATTTTEGRRV